MQVNSSINYSVVVAGFLVLLFSMGVRQSFGLLMMPVTCTTDITGLDFSMVIAVQNLLWGAFAFLFGFLVAEIGEKTIILFGSALVIIGLMIIYSAKDPTQFLIGAGIFMGVGLGALSFSIVLATVGKHIPTENAGMIFAIVSSGGSIGQFLLLPAVKWGLLYFPWQYIILAMALGSLLLFPAGWICANSGNHNESSSLENDLEGEPKKDHKQEIKQESDHKSKQALGQKPRKSSYKQSVLVLVKSFNNFSYILINIGFAICGFHVTLISIHLPHYFQSLNSTDISYFAGATALSIIGFFNIIGTLGTGWLMKYINPKSLLIALYGMRSLLLLIFILSPKNNLNIAIFSLFIGLVWLATVPITSNLINKLFGKENLALLFGMAMFFHQIGAFFGAYAGGWFLNNYESVWLIAMFLSLLASLIHLPVKHETQPTFKSDLSTQKLT